MKTSGILTIKELLVKKIVVKVGSSSLTNGTKNLCRRQMVELVRQFCHLHNEGFEVVVVSSGAVAAGERGSPC